MPGITLQRSNELGLGRIFRPDVNIKILNWRLFCHHWIQRAAVAQALGECRRARRHYEGRKVQP